jgi:hypothetical protein
MNNRDIYNLKPSINKLTVISYILLFVVTALITGIALALIISYVI